MPKTVYSPLPSTWLDKAYPEKAPAPKVEDKEGKDVEKDPIEDPPPSPSQVVDMDWTEVEDRVVHAVSE